MTTAKFGSAGVTVREIDLSSPLTVAPSGIPAGVIGTANKGPAYVPVTVGVIGDFYAKFGTSDGKKFGPLAAGEWLRNASSLTYMRVLGIGDGLKRASTGNLAGSVTSAGFTVGENQPDATTGTLTSNPYANSGGPDGRTYFLGCFMSESAGSTVFSAAGAQSSTTAVPIVRGVVLAASGVILRMSSSLVASTAPASSYVAAVASAAGASLGDVVLLSGARVKQEFTLLLNGHKGTDPSYPNVITASFDMTAPNYFANVLNNDPLKLQQAGYCVYTSYDVYPTVASVTGSGLLSASHGAGASAAPKAGAECSAFITTGSSGYNVGTSTAPNYENFNTRFSSANSPWIISQKFGGYPINLFRLVSVDSGAGTAEKIKFSIENIAKSTDPAYLYGTFDLVVRDIADRDDESRVLEAFRGLSLDPMSDRYIAKVVGDLNVYYEFDKVENSQKLVVEGNYPNKSNYVRVEVESIVDNGDLDPVALPVGFRGIAHLVTAGTAPLAATTSTALLISTALQNTVELPLPLRSSIAVGSGNKIVANSSLYWGSQFEHVTNPALPNGSTLQNKTLTAFMKYFPDFMTVTQNFVVSNNQGVADTAANGILDADRFNNNMFTLENVQVVTNSLGLADASSWSAASYIRQGNIVANGTDKTRAWTVNDLTQQNRKFCKFSFFMQGGFDGVNIFNKEESELSNVAVTDDMNAVNRGLSKGPNVTAYTKAITIMKNTVNADIQLLAIPGIRHSVVTDTAADAVRERFDALYLMDIEEYDNTDTLITADTQVPHVQNTVLSFKDRAVDNSFAAAYYPDVTMTDPNTRTTVMVPPSVAVLGALAYNDAIGYPWFAPAGFTRGALSTAIDAKVKLYKDNLDALYEAAINPLVSFPGQAANGAANSGLMVWGQKTLQAAASALDRVNVRRLLISLRREVKDVANTFIFEPNRASTLTRFSAAVTPRLERVKTQRGIEQYLVKIDTSTTTQLDVENNTIRGKVFIVPTRSVEFVSIDFVVTNRGQQGV